MRLKRSYNSGVILVDILLALILGTLFISIIVESSLGSREVFEHAQARQEIIETYESATTSFSTSLYGNDRIETDKTEFISVHIYPFAQLSDSAGTPLCSVDFFRSREKVTPRITTIVLPLSQSINLSDIQVRNNVAFISANSSVVSDPDLFVYDISDAENPHQLSSINTGPGISAIALSGKRIYAAADSTAAQLHIIRFDDLISPVLENKYKLLLPYATATPSVGTSVFYYKGTLYLGTEKWDGDEFNVLNVSNPTQPLKVSGFELGSRINTLYVHNAIGYVGTAGQNQLVLLDLRDPAQPQQLNSFSPSGWQRQEGQSLNLFEDSLNYGRTSGGFDIPTDLELFSWASSSLSSLISPYSMNEPGGVYGLIADRNHIFVGTRQTGKEFQLFNRKLSATSSTTYALPASVESMTCDGDSLYILGHLSPVIYRLTFN